MSKNRFLGTVLSSAVLVLVLYVGGSIPHPAVAAETGEPAQLVAGYLESLASGDIGGILASVDGRMREANKALEESPDTYSEFLRNHYLGVEMAVEDISRQGNNARARVRFDYPNSESSTVVLILTRRHGTWKISDEEY
jgi:hypothetical protein